MQLRKLGVLSWRLDADAHRTDPKLSAIREARGYSYEVWCTRAVWTSVYPTSHACKYTIVLHVPARLHISRKACSVCSNM